MMDTAVRRESRRALVSLAFPVILEEILSTLLQYVDTAMIGHLGAEATASVSLTTTVNWLIGSLFASVGVALVAIISSSYGAGDDKRMHRAGASAFLYAIVSGTAVAAVALSISRVLPVWMNADEAIREDAGRYFAIISIAIPFRALSIMEASAMRAVKDTRTPMAVNLLQNGINIVLNYILIYPAGLGVRGAAIATLVSYGCGGLLMTRSAWKNRLISFTKDDFRGQKEILKETVSIALPAAATNATSCLAHIVFASLVSGMGTVVFAAHSIALSAETIFYVPGYGLRSATSTLVGISLGEDDREKFRLVERQSVVLTVVMMAVTGAALFIFSTPVMAIFTPDRTVQELGAGVLALVALSEPVFGLMIVSEGICYGLGDTRFPFIVETIGAWGIRILFTWTGIRFLHIGLRGVWICMLLDNTFRAALLSIPLLTGRDLKLYKRRKAAMEARK